MPFEAGCVEAGQAPVLAGEIKRIGRCANRQMTRDRNLLVPGIEAARLHADRNVQIEPDLHAEIGAPGRGSRAIAGPPSIARIRRIRSRRRLRHGATQRKPRRQAPATPRAIPPRLVESERRYRDLYEEAPNAYVAFGKDLRLTSVNRRAAAASRPAYGRVGRFEYPGILRGFNLGPDTSPTSVRGMFRRSGDFRTGAGDAPAGRGPLLGQRLDPADARRGRIAGGGAFDLGRCDRPRAGPGGSRPGWQSRTSTFSKSSSPSTISRRSSAGVRLWSLCWTRFAVSPRPTPRS